MKCLFCMKPMTSKIEMHVKACNGCIVKLLMKKHNLTVKKQAPVNFNTKKFNKE